MAILGMNINFSPDSYGLFCRLNSNEDDEDIELPDLIEPKMSELGLKDGLKIEELSPESSNVNSEITLDNAYSGEIAEISTNKTVSGFIIKSAPRSCQVCGYPTTCLHYEASSCHACKTFYRRSVLTSARYVCKFQRQCDIQSGVRCRSCRYDQCFRAGMNPESIRLVGEPSNSAHITAIQLAKERRKDLVKEEWRLRNEIKFVPRFEQTSDARAVDFLSRLEVKYDQLRESSYTAGEFYESNIRDLLRTQCQLGNADKYSGTLSLTTQSDNSTPIMPKRSWFIFDLILNLEYLKAFPFFYELDLNDQECLAMHVVIVNTVLSETWYSYKHNYTTLVMPDGSMPITMRRVFHLSDFYPTTEKIELETFCRSIEPLLRVLPNDEEYFLLKAIIYCHSETPGLSQRARDLLDAHRQIFASALLRRIQARMGAAEGARKYSELIGLIQTFFYFGQKHREFQVFVNYVCEKAGSPRQLPALTDWFIKNSSKFD